MYAKAKGSHVPSSEIQAKEKLAIYVYEYLMHTGAKQTASMFLNEIRFEKPLQQLSQLNEPPGFLLSWWCVFWDLYCAAPERRDIQTECSSDAKAFHEYGFMNSGGYNVPNGMQNSAANSPLTQMPPQDNMPSNNPMQPNNFFSPNSQPPPPPTPVNQMMMQNQGYPRYPSGPRPMRVPSTTDYNGPNSVQGPQMGMDTTRVAPGLNPLSRLTPPGGRPQVPPSALSQMGNYNSQTSQQVPPSQVPQPNQPPPPNMGMRGQQQGPPSQMGPQMGGPNAALSPMPPMNMSNQPRWPGPQSAGPPPMSYSSPSPVPYGAQCGPGPGTPIMQSPQDSSGDMNFTMMKNVSGGMNYHEPNMSHMVPINSEMSHHTQHMNGDMMDTLKNSPISNIQNPRHTDEHSNTGPINDIPSFSHFSDGSVQNDSDAILKLKESMQEETKRFEKHQHDMYSECN